MEGILNLENWRKFTKWLINNICYYIHINRTKNAHLRIYK